MGGAWLPNKVRRFTSWENRAFQGYKSSALQGPFSVDNIGLIKRAKDVARLALLIKSRRHPSNLVMHATPVGASIIDPGDHNGSTYRQPFPVLKCGED